MAKHKLTPCSTCPWRVDQDASTIPRYSQEKAEGLLDTVGEGDAFRKVMACHHSTDEKMVPCRGYLAQEGWRNITVRLLVAQNQSPSPDEVSDACTVAGIALEPDYPTVLEKLTRTACP